ncbi:MAG: LysR family transcriptional regulator [Alcaligenaceae bacterium]|nr:LysR family transcriptional regulator [Alcaligenaceae bacterium]
MARFQDSRSLYLYEAVTQGTIRAAADRLGIAPSAVSRQISLLEEEVGTTLIERHRSGVAPTEAGRLMVDYHRQHAAHRYDMQAKIDALRGLHSGSVSVVCGEGFAEDMITGPVHEFHREHPGISISLEITGTTEIMRRVTEDKAEIGLVYYASADPHIVSRRAARQPMLAIIGPSNPLRDAACTTLEELQNWPIALLKGIYGIRQIIEHAEHADRIRLHPTLTTNLISVLEHFVANDQGITLLPPFAVATAIKAGKLHAVPVQNAALQNAEVQLITRAGRHLSPAANRFLQYCMHGMEAFQG